MRKPTLLTVLALVALLLVACKPDPASLVFEVDNRAAAGGPAVCSVELRAKVTLPYGEGTTELGAAPGREDGAVLSLPHLHEGDPVTVEAWCETDAAIGYTRVTGTLPSFYPASFIRVYPPRDSEECLPHSESAAPAPCLTGYFVKPDAAAQGR